MFKQSFHRIRRIVLAGLLACTGHLHATAHHLETYNDLVAVPGLMTTCNFDQTVGRANFGCATHDSCPVSIAVKEVESQDVVAIEDRPEAESEKMQDAKPSISVTSITAAVVSTAGVKVQQVIEPFAMVGPSIGGSYARVKEFQAWWENAIAESAHLHTESSIEREIAEVASAEPIDIERFGDSVLIPQVASIVVEALDPRLGSSPMIVTIPFQYTPYDVSAKDIKFWSVFPSAARPFCVRDQFDESGADKMWEVAEESHPPVEEAVTLTETVKASPDCLLDEAVWNLQTWAEQKPLASLATPDAVGRRLASLVDRSSAVAFRAVDRLAAVWPDVAVDNHDAPSPTGQKLLARANASVETGVEASSEVDVAVEISSERIATVPDAATVR